MADEGLSIPDAARLAGAYREVLVRHGLAPVTVKVYEKGLRGMIDFARPSGIVNRASIRGWSADQHRRFRPRTAALNGVTVRRMLAWAAERGECSFGLSLAVPVEHYDRALPLDPLTPEHLDKIKAYLFGQPDGAMDARELRDRALFYYLLATAARVGEVLQMRRATFDRQTVRQTRSRGEKLLAPPKGVVELVRQYLAAREDDLEWLWVGLMPDGRVTRFTDEGVSRSLRRIADRAGVPRFRSYDVRHTAGVLLAEQGHDLGDIRTHFGVGRLDTIQRYREHVARSGVDGVRAALDVVPR